MECVSIGFLIAEDAASKTIAPHIAYPNEETSQAAGIMIIPAASITSVMKLVI